MVIRDRTADDDLNEVVRRRLDALLAEIPPRRALDHQPGMTMRPNCEAARQRHIGVPAF